MLFLHWNVGDKNISSMKYLRDYALKRDVRVVVFIQNTKAKGLNKKAYQNEAGRQFLEIEHPDLTQTAIREVLEQEMKAVVTEFLFKDGGLHIEEEAFKARDSEVARLYGDSFINLCNLFENDTSDLEQANLAVNGLFKEVIEFQGKFRSEKLFPLQLEHDRLIGMENEIDHCENPAERSKLLENCEKSKRKMKSVELAIFLKKIVDASTVSNFGSIVRLFVMQLKQFITPIVGSIRNKILEV